MKYKLNFNVPFKRASGESIKDGNGNEMILSNLLALNLENAQDPSKNARKLGVFAYDLYKTNELELDEVDSKLLEDWIENNANFTVLFKCALLEVFKNKEELA